MKTLVKNLSVANIKGTNFVRREDLDFSDDGNRFRGFAYDNGEEQLPITTLYSDGSVYCDVRPDYLNYKGIPWELWHETEEYKLCDKYNGTSDLIDLEDLENICEKVLAKLNSMKVELDNMDLTKQEEEIYKVLCREDAELKRFIEKVENFNWFKLLMSSKISDWDFRHLKDYFNSVKGELEQVNVMMKELEEGTMSKKNIIHHADCASRGFVVLGSRFYIKQIEEMMNK